MDTGAPANGGSCVAHHDGRVVFVRYALPGERVRVRVTADRGSYWHAEVIEVVEPSADRIRVAVPDRRGGRCRVLRSGVRPPRGGPGAQGAGRGQSAGTARRISMGRPGRRSRCRTRGPTGWRTRVRLDVGGDRRPGFHRYHSDELVTDLRCAQLPAGMLDGLRGIDWQPRAQLHVALDDDGQRHVVRSVRQGKRTATKVVEGDYTRCSGWAGAAWRVPVTAFWQAHRDAARSTALWLLDWAQPAAGMTRLGSLRRRGCLRGGAGRGGGGVRAGADGRHLARRDASQRGMRWPICRRWTS